MSVSAAGAHRPTVLITGASGLIGSALQAQLRAEGFGVMTLSRRSAEDGDDDANQPWWDVDAGRMELGDNPAPTAVIHLAGENIGQGRWTKARKQRFVHSRVRGTTVLCEWLAQLPTPPEVLISASATGIYGNREEEELTESSAVGTGFLADLCHQWESSTAAAEDVGIRVVHLRTGVVLTPEGGALRKMLLPFKLGLGGRMGSGRQWMSWISLGDAVNAIVFALHESTSVDAPSSTPPLLRGAVNLVSPQPVRQIDFARTLAATLKRPAIAPMPAFAIKLLFGEMGRALVLDGAKVQPAALVKAGFRFSDPDLAAYLRHRIGR